MASAPFVDILICFLIHRAVRHGWHGSAREHLLPDIFDDSQKLCGFAYGIDHDALPMLR